MRESRKASGWRDHVVILMLTFCVALAVRVYWTHDQVFPSATSGATTFAELSNTPEVRFRGTDAWYRVRLVENLLAHFPTPITYDPYLLHPGGARVTEAPLFDYVLAIPAWILGGGQPSPRLIETVAAWMPAILGALVAVPVYLLAHLLWGRPAGLIAATLIGVMPGRFLDRSLLGAADHHVAEVLWSTGCLLFLMAAFDRARRERSEGLRPVILPMAAGMFLAAYLLSWRSGTALPCLLAAWATVQAIADRLRGQTHGRTSHTARILIPTLATALVVILPWLDGTRVPHLHTAVLVLAMMLTAVMTLITKRPSDTTGPAVPKAVWRALTLLIVGGGATVAVLFPSQLTELGGLFQRLLPTPWAMTVAEMRPMHLDDSLWLALWREFTTATIAAGIGLALVAWRGWRRGRPEDLLLLVWSLAMLTASLGQRRFTYYLAVVVALLSAAAVVWILSSLAAAASATPARARWRPMALAGLAAVLILPNVRAATVKASRDNGPDTAWHEAALWMRSNTPEPFGDPNFYFDRYREDSRSTLDLAAGRDQTYGVMAWWDRGFWLTRIARRVPVTNPKGHGVATAAAFFLGEDLEIAARQLADVGASYVVVDADMPIRQAGNSEIGLGSIASMARWLGLPVERYVERYELRSANGRWQPIFLYYPDYFRSMAVRLQTFSGRAASPSQVWVVSFREVQRPDGAIVKRIRNLEPFDSYQEAVESLSSDPRSRRLVSLDPGSTCVPLEALDGFLRRVYPEGDADADVRVFEVQGVVTGDSTARLSYQRRERLSFQSRSPS